MCVVQVAPFSYGLHPWLTLDMLTLGCGTLWIIFWPWRQDCTSANPVSLDLAFTYDL